MTGAPATRAPGAPVTRAPTPRAGSLRRNAGLVLVLAAFAVAALFASAVPALAAPVAIGYDLSYPQCETLPPLAASFAIVGVDGGLANNLNPCLVQQLTWASMAPGLRRPALPGLSLYLDAADPGNGVADWPSPDAGTADAGTPYGTCNGSWSRACAFNYAMQRASYSYALVVAAAPLAAATSPSLTVAFPSPAATAPWWIDVEIGASWARRSSSHAWAQLNVAALRGYVAGLRAAGARGPVGIYSNSYQWHVITGLGSRASKAYFRLGERDWVTGAKSLAQAQRACARSFSGSVVEIAQFTEGAFDRDYACPASSSK